MQKVSGTAETEPCHKCHFRRGHTRLNRGHIIYYICITAQLNTDKDADKHKSKEHFVCLTLPFVFPLIAGYLFRRTDCEGATRRIASPAFCFFLFVISQEADWIGFRQKEIVITVEANMAELGFFSCDHSASHTVPSIPKTY